MAAEKFNLSHWSKNHFIVFILLCIADSDNHMDEEEIIEITKLIKIDGDIQQVVAEVHAVILILPEEYRMELLATKKTQFNLSIEEVENTLHTIEDIILADTSIERAEIAMYSKIKKILEA